MAKIKDGVAAVGRALEKSAALSVEDRATVLSRITKGTPAMDLQNMAYIEEIANNVVADDREFLVRKIKALQSAASAPTPPSA